mgnify:CR=1 FL=1
MPTGVYIRTEEHKRKISIANQDKKLTEEHKRKIGDFFRGKRLSNEHIKKISGERSHRWKGGRRKELGYVLIYKPEHPFAVKKYVQEHRLIVEEARKITLNPWMIVHHINGIKDDNRLENLRVMTRSEHTSLHFIKIKT